MQFLSSLRRAARFYGLVTLAGPIMLFAGVEGWRLVQYVGTDVMAPDQASSCLRAVGLIVCLMVGGGYLREHYLATRSDRAGRVVLVSVNLLFGGIALYGLFDLASRLIPAFSELGALSLTYFTLAAALGIGLLLHRRPHR